MTEKQTFLQAACSHHVSEACHTPEEQAHIHILIL